MATFGGLAIGAWFWGVVAEAHGVREALLLAACATFLCALTGRWLPLAQAEKLNLDPAGRWQAPAAAPIDPRTGPVVVTVEYRIHQDDVLEFLGAMAERGRIRRRDGARHWTLLRDLADPEIWVERYETATWLDYIRHHSRLTQDDAVIPARIRALHRDREPPRVRRMIERQTGSLPIGRTPNARELAEPLTDPSLS
jgi:hypothetical protein